MCVCFLTGNPLWSPSLQAVGYHVWGPGNLPGRHFGVAHVGGWLARKSPALPPHQPRRQAKNARDTLSSSSVTWKPPLLDCPVCG